jgi:6-phosphogluconolactonase
MIEIIRAQHDLAEVASGVLMSALKRCLRQRPRVALALSGGRTPWTSFRLLAKAELDWSRVDVYQVDERIAPAHDRARNLEGLRDALLDHVPARVFPMPIEERNLELAAERYGNALPELLDIVHLGLGDDGHTASLVPGDPVLDVSGRLVAVTQPYRGYRRMTFTFPAFERADKIVWIVAGADKARVLSRLIAADRGIPAGRVPQARAVLVTDTPSG